MSHRHPSTARAEHVPDITLLSPAPGGMLVFRVRFVCCTCYAPRTETVEAQSWGAVAQRYEAPRCRGCRR
jgi:hypothetical protein